MGYDCVAINIDVGDISVTDEMVRIFMCHFNSDMMNSETRNAYLQY